MSLATAVPTEQEPRPKRARRSQATRSEGRRLPKSKDASMTKVSFYLTDDTAKLLSVVATMRGEDQSDIVERVLRQHMPSVRAALGRLMGDPADSADRSADGEMIDRQAA